MNSAQENSEKTRRRILVTGVNGFVARFLVEALRQRGDEVIGVDVAPRAAHPVARYYACDLLDANALRIILEVEKPTHIVHLAAVSSVAKSWESPVESFLNNTNVFLNVVESVRKLGLETRILSVGSSEEYGVVPLAETPIAETRRLAPCSPYAVARVAQEQLSELYVRGYGLDIVMTRSFNQIGPGQRPAFVVPSFVQQLVAARAAGAACAHIKAGDLGIVRDFLDVRDAVAAYLALLDKGVSGEVYNVCSGTGRRLDEVLRLAAEVVGVEVETEVDPALVRPADNPVIIGDNAKIYKATGWRPQRELRASLRDIVAAASA
jgi:GDP-4-dehydro-6-deoxy-D-mannose reductase